MGARTGLIASLHAECKLHRPRINGGLRRRVSPRHRRVASPRYRRVASPRYRRVASPRYRRVVLPRVATTCEVPSPAASCVKRLPMRHARNIAGRDDEGASAASSGAAGSARVRRLPWDPPGSGIEVRPDRRGRPDTRSPHLSAAASLIR